MGKGKNKKKKKNKEDQLPTHLAGVQLPDELREVAGAATQLMRHPLVSNLVTAGVLAAVAALAEDENVRRAARSAGEEAEDMGDEAVRTASRAKVAVKAAAGAMGQRLLDEVKVAADAKKAKAPAHAG